jgi:hypothetical protein
VCGAGQVDGVEGARQSSVALQTARGWRVGASAVGSVVVASGVVAVDADAGAACTGKGVEGVTTVDDVVFIVGGPPEGRMQVTVVTVMVMVPGGRVGAVG